MIPVYNGDGVIAETIARLAMESGEFLNLVVVVNGSSDNSMEVAEAALREVASTGASCHLVELDTASRTAALNAADAMAISSAHHLYLDQDVRISAGGLGRILATLDQGAEFVGGSAVWRTPSRVVRAAMEAWNSLPYVRNGPVTAGMYAVSAQGRGRWNDWPAGLPDDKFARLHFLPAERARLEDVEYSALAPSNLIGLVIARTRYALSNRNLMKMSRTLAETDSGRGIQNLVGFPFARLPGLAVLAAAEFAAQLRVRLWIA